MKKVVHRRYGRVIIIVLVGIFICAASLSYQKVFAREFAERVNITLYYRVRFEILGQTQKGLYYIDLFDRYTSEITKTTLNHPALFVESLSIIKAWEPYLDAFVNGRGDKTIITQKIVNGVMTYLDHLEEVSSPELRSIIKQERSALPLEATSGMTLNHAWRYINQDSRFSLPDTSYPARIAPTNVLSDQVFWTVPEAPPLSIKFDPNVWELVSWNNGVAPSWELKHRSLYDCVVTVPRLVNDPYAMFDISTKSLGELPYEVRSSRFSELTLYSLYVPLYISPQGNEFQFIVYPGYVDTQACIEQSEALLGNIYVSR